MSAALAASPAVLADAKHDANERGTRLSAVIIDVRSPDARAVGRAATAHGLPVHVIRADLGELYYAQLAPYWRQHGQSAIGGLTTAPALFYLERLAWGADMRVVFLGRHDNASAAEPQHALRGPSSAVDLFHDSVRVIDWHIALAGALTRVPVTTPALPVNAVRDAVIAGDDALFSWVLAPSTRGASAPPRLPT